MVSFEAPPEGDSAKAVPLPHLGGAYWVSPPPAASFVSLDVAAFQYQPGAGSRAVSVRVGKGVQHALLPHARDLLQCEYDTAALRAPADCRPVQLARSIEN
jgi:hypothetical protein